jgi:hypothetical protein
VDGAYGREGGRRPRIEEAELAKGVIEVVAAVLAFGGRDAEQAAQAWSDELWIPSGEIALPRLVDEGGEERASDRKQAELEAVLGERAAGAKALPRGRGRLNTALKERDGAADVAGAGASARGIAIDREIRGLSDR